VTKASEPVPAAVGVVPVVNVANGLTALRIMLVPVFVALVVVSEMTHPGWRIAACLTFAFASATDFVDGWIARRFALVTSFGKVADPIADKALTGSALVLLSWYDRLPWWVTAVVLGREFGVTLIRFWVIRYGVIAASRGGKIKTALQIVAIVWYLWPVPATISGVGPWLVVAAVAVTLFTGLDYVVRALRLRRPAGAAPGA
jgi:CDP-diacylglycerol--glycerol-3-phosphate 3-phosphatidyltransferase